MVQYLIFIMNLCTHRFLPLIFYNQLELLSLSGNFVSSLSDYFTQFLLLKNSATVLKNHSKKETGTYFSRFNDDELKNELKNKNWNVHCFSSNDININWENFL